MGKLLNGKTKQKQLEIIADCREREGDLSDVYIKVSAIVLQFIECGRRDNRLHRRERSPSQSLQIETRLDASRDDLKLLVLKLPHQTAASSSLSSLIDHSLLGRRENTWIDFVTLFPPFFLSTDDVRWLLLLWMFF